MEIIGFIVTLFIGLLVGLFGGGGSILTVPVLVYLFAIPATLSTTYSLALVSITSLIAATPHVVHKKLSFKKILQFGIPSMLALTTVRYYIIPALPLTIYLFGFELEKNLFMMGQNYWDTRWEKQETGWDIGYASPTITEFMDGIADKNTAILIPGCGNAYEAEYLLKQGFTNITLIDIAPLAVENLKKKFEGQSSINILCEDFFEHKGSYHLIIEQTFFSAIPPFKRKDYVAKMHELLKENGRIIGLLFDKQFNKPYPPFGGNTEEYQNLFQPYFNIKKLEESYNSIPPRQGSEVFIHLIKK